MFADGVAVVFDFVGVCAGVALFIAAAPELLGGAAVIGTAGIVTGTLAAVGSGILLLLDGQVFAAEYHDDHVKVEQLENDHTRQWFRVVATMMLLPDLPVGGVRALTELGKASREAAGARGAGRAFEARVVAQRERAGIIRHPERHPGPVQRHAARANRAARAAAEQHRDVTRAVVKMTRLTVRDINANFVATPGSAATLAGLPPSILESHSDLERDKRLLEALVPEHGMPRDVRFEMRMTGISRYTAPH